MSEHGIKGPSGRRGSPMTPKDMADYDAHSALVRQALERRARQDAADRERRKQDTPRRPVCNCDHGGLMWSEHRSTCPERPTYESTEREYYK